MNQTLKDTSMAYKKKSCYFNDFSIVDAENFEPPQLSSTPSKNIKKNSKKILKENYSLNLSIIDKEDQNKKSDLEIEKLPYKHKISVVEENYKHNQAPELFYSDPEESLEMYKNINDTIINDSDDKWTTLTDISEDKTCTDISDLLAEIDTEIEVRFEKPPRRSYPGKKRNNNSLFEDKEEKEEVEVQLAHKHRKPKQKKKINPQEEAFITSINEHFNDVETFNLAVD